MKILRRDRNVFLIIQLRSYRHLIYIPITAEIVSGGRILVVLRFNAVFWLVMIFFMFDWICVFSHQVCTFSSNMRRATHCSVSRSSRRSDFYRHRWKRVSSTSVDSMPLSSWSRLYRLRVVCMPSTTSTAFLKARLYFMF